MAGAHASTDGEDAHADGCGRRPCAPAARNEWPETLSDPSGAANSTPNRAAARTIVALIASFVHAAPSTVGKSGCSKEDDAKCHLSEANAGER